MTRLAARLFLWFWAVTAVVAAVLVATSPLLTRTRPGIRRWEHGAAQMLERHVRHVATAVQRGGLRHRPLRGRRRMTLWLVTPDGKRVHGPPPPPGVVALAREAATSPGEVLTARRGTLHLAAVTASDPRGRALVVVAGARRPPSVLDLLEPRVVLPRLALLLVVLGLVAALLARRLTSPLDALSQATRRLAAGDLSARVGEPLVRRRDEFGQLARDFDAMAQRLEGLVEAQRRLLRDVSHELRSPLARMQVALELAASDERSERAEALDRIALEAARLDRLIGRLLTLSRLEAGAQTLARELLPLHRLVAEVVEDARYEAANRQVLLRTELAETMVAGDPQLLRAAVENVVRNAVRYTDPDTEVWVGLREEKANAVLVVADRGPGVPEEHLDDLFRPFFRVQNDRARVSGGTGLGLAITAAAIHAHGGRIRATNREGGGLEVRIELPLAAAADRR